ncbi:hypothetical protein LDENG_00211810, partial [Lucifuga dentata]
FFSFRLSLQGSPQRIICLHLTLSSASSSLTPTNFMSSFTTSINLLFGLPLGLLPGSSNLSILLPICSLSLLCTCPNHLSLASLTLSPKHLTCAVPLMYSFLILSILVTPKENLSILVSATSSSASCLFLSATVSKPYNIAGLTTVLYTFPFILAETLLSHITPDTFLHPFQPACTRFFTSFPHSPLLWTVDPKYLKSSTFFISIPCNLTIPLESLSFTAMYSVLLRLTFIPLLSRAYLHLSRFSSTCSLLSLQITMSSANIIVQGDSCLTSSVSLSITTANKKGLRADPWCSPTSTLNSSVTPTAHLTTVLQLSYMSCTTLTYFSATPDFLIQHHSSSLGTLSYAFSRSTKAQCSSL